MRCGRGAQLRELLVVVRPRELRVDPLERAGVTGLGAERALEVGGGAELVAEDVAEECGGAEEELRLHRGEERLQLASGRERLVREGELRHAIVADGGFVERLPDRSVQLVARQRDEQGVDHLFFVLEPRLERELRHAALGVLLHGREAWGCKGIGVCRRRNDR